MTRFTLHLPDAPPTSVTLNLPGRHNVQNALAAAAIGWQLGVEPLAIARALEKFQGIGRRFNLHGEKASARARPCWSTTTATIRPNSRRCSRPRARGWPARRLVVAFQPHRYTRTRDLLRRFRRGAVRSRRAGADRGLCRRRSADRRCRCESRWRARSAPVVASIRCWCRMPKALPGVLPDMLHDGDLLILMGAGDIGAAAHRPHWRRRDSTEQIAHDPATQATAISVGSPC
jgi:UDP-N-acetylmuramate--alanine ligase